MRKSNRMSELLTYYQKLMMESENQTGCRGRNLCAVWLSFFIWKLMKEKRYQKRNMQQFLRIIDK